MTLFKPSPWDGLFRASPFDQGGGGVLPPVGCDPYNGVMTVGNNTSGQYGFNTDGGLDTYGAMNPLAINGVNIYQWVFITGTNSIILNLVTSSKIPGEPENNSSILVTIGTNPEVEIPWGGGSYSVVDAGLVNYIVSEDGNQLPVCINWGTGDPPE